MTEAPEGYRLHSRGKCLWCGADVERFVRLTDDSPLIRDPDGKPHYRTCPRAPEWTRDRTPPVRKGLKPRERGFQ